MDNNTGKTEDDGPDPLANLVPPVEKHRFAHLEWPIWDQSVFSAEMYARENGQEIALIAGYAYTLRCLSSERPPQLVQLLDTPTRNFLMHWAAKGILFLHQDALEKTKGNSHLLASFQAGVAYAIENLRGEEMPEKVKKEDVKQLLDAFEADGHEKFVAMSVLGSVPDAEDVVGEVVEVIDPFSEVDADDGENDYRQRLVEIKTDDEEDGTGKIVGPKVVSKKDNVEHIKAKHTQAEKAKD